MYITMIYMCYVGIYIGIYTIRLYAILCLSMYNGVQNKRRIFAIRPQTISYTCALKLSIYIYTPIKCYFKP